MNFVTWNILFAMVIDKIILNDTCLNISPQKSGKIC